MIPKALCIRKSPIQSTMQNLWNQILSKCSLQLMSLIVTTEEKKTLENVQKTTATEM